MKHLMNWYGNNNDCCVGDCYIRVTDCSIRDILQLIFTMLRQCPSNLTITLIIGENHSNVHSDTYTGSVIT